MLVLELLCVFAIYTLLRHFEAVCTRSMPGLTINFIYNKCRIKIYARKKHKYVYLIQCINVFMFFSSIYLDSALIVNEVNS